MPIARKGWCRSRHRCASNGLLPLNEKRVEWGTLKILSAADYTARRDCMGHPPHHHRHQINRNRTNYEDHTLSDICANRPIDTSYLALHFPSPCGNSRALSLVVCHDLGHTIRRCSSFADRLCDCNLHKQHLHPPKSGPICSGFRNSRRLRNFADRNGFGWVYYPVVSSFNDRARRCLYHQTPCAAGSNRLRHSSDVVHFPAVLCAKSIRPCPTHSPTKSSRTDHNRSQYPHSSVIHGGCQDG